MVLGAAGVGALVVALLVAMLVFGTGPSASDSDDTEVSSAEAELAELQKELIYVQETLDALESLSGMPPTARLDRVQSTLTRLRSSALEDEAGGALDTCAKRLAALRAAREAVEEKKAADEKKKAEEAAEHEREQAALANIDEGLEEFAFVVRAKLFSALQYTPDNLLLAGAEAQQGSGLRNRLQAAVRRAKTARALINVALRPEWVGLLSSKGYDNLASWASDYIGKFRNSEAWTHWTERQLPDLEIARQKALDFESALEKVKAAWKAKAHGSAVAALEDYREARAIWGPALLAWVETDQAKAIWGMLPLRPETTWPGEEKGQPGEEGPSDPVAQSSGTGFFVAPGFVMTNAHVVGKARTVEVQMPKQKGVKGEVVATGSDIDLALIKVSSGLKGTPLKFCPGSIAIGADIFTYGYGQIFTGSGRLSNEQAAWGDGSVAQFQKEPSRRLIVFNGRVNPGNSGGPLVDEGGNWIGVVVAKTRTVGFIEGSGYAIHGEDALRWVNEHLAKHDLTAPSTTPPRRPLRGGTIAGRLPASVVRVVAGGQ